MATGYTGLRYRDGDVMIVAQLEAHSAIIDFEEILAATKVVPDEHNDEAPWDACDGWEHNVIPLRQFDGSEEWATAQQGYCWCPASAEQLVITIDDATVKAWIDVDYLRRKGASRQTAAELVACTKAQALQQLCKWYRRGWYWYGVRCEFNGYEDSVWGIDDEKYAEEHVRLEIAGQVAWQLENDGYTVINEPVQRGCTREDKLAELRRKLNSQNWHA